MICSKPMQGKLSGSDTFSVTIVFVSLLYRNTDTENNLLTKENLTETNYFFKGTGYT